MIPELLEFLIRERAPFEVIEDREADTTQKRAAVSHISGRRLAKAVIFRDGGSYGMAVVPAAAQLDLAELQRRIRRYGLALASQDELERLFPDGEIGAVPPFGRLFGLPVYLDRTFAAEAEMVFESGTHRALVRMPMGEYVRIERPGIVPLVRLARAA
jgi:Ala-tRNA(Pro) deacylase